MTKDERRAKRVISVDVETQNRKKKKRGYYVALLAIVLVTTGVIAFYTTGLDRYHSKIPSTRDAATVSYAFQIEGMHCDGCAETIRERLGKMPGVKSVTASFKDRKATVECDSEQPTSAELAQAIKDAGYRPTPLSK